MLFKMFCGDVELACERHPELLEASNARLEYIYKSVELALKNKITYCYLNETELNTIFGEKGES